MEDFGREIRNSFLRMEFGMDRDLVWNNDYEVAGRKTQDQIDGASQLSLYRLWEIRKGFLTPLFRYCVGFARKQWKE